jgi:hypothetical protein
VRNPGLVSWCLRGPVSALRSWCSLRFVPSFDSPWAAVGAVAAGYLVLLLLVLRAHGFQPSALAQVGDGFADPARVPRNLVVWPNTNGYDGEFYYRLALDPFTDRVTDFGITFDNAAYRQQRIVYPLLAWALALGRPELVPLSLILVNWLGLCLLAWVGWRYARTVEGTGLWGLVFPFYPGFVYTLIRDMTEIWAIGLMLAGLLALRHARQVVAALLLTLAVLTRETTILVTGGAIAASLLGARTGEAGYPRERVAPRWCLFLIPIAVYTLWQLALYARWGQVPFLVASTSAGLPFSGFADALARNAGLATHEQWRWFGELLFLAALSLAAAWLLRSSAATLHEKLCWLLYAALVSVLAGDIWHHDLGFLRATADFFVFGAIVILGSRPRARFPLLGASLVWWVVSLLVIYRFYR